MNGLIKETNENLKAIVDTLKTNLETSINTLDNIQTQMDKKVEEAKKYKIQVDSAKEIIRGLEDENRSFELSLKELNDKYGKMNLVSVIEAGNREIKSKINENIREINKQKEHIADLTNKARTIKDLLINLKKDKTLKEEKLEDVKVVYEYYSERINDVIDYAFNHSENLSDYKSVSFVKEDFNEVEVSNKELENTMVFDEIANIDENKLFKDEMSFINDQIDNDLSVTELDSSSGLDDNIFDDEEIDEESIDISGLDTTQVFDAIIEPDYNVDDEEEESSTGEEPFSTFIEEETFNDVENQEIDNPTIEDSYINELESSDKNDENEDLSVKEEKILDSEEISSKEDFNNFLINDFNSIELDPEKLEEEHNLVKNTEDVNKISDNIELNQNDIVKTEVITEDEEISKNEDVLEKEKSVDEPFTNFNDLNFDINAINVPVAPIVGNEFNVSDENYLDNDVDERSNKIENLFSTLDNIKIDKTQTMDTFGIEEKIDNMYSDTFGKSINEEIKVESTLTDIFGNPIKSEEINVEQKLNKRIEDLFIENGIDFNRFKEDEQNYLREIYDEDKFVNIFNTLKRNKINVDNVYNAFNIFGEISANELENLISKLLNIGQSVEAIGIVLEKLPRVKKYNLDEAIMSYGDYIKDIDITELIIKAKELYKNGGNV